MPRRIASVPPTAGRLEEMQHRQNLVDLQRRLRGLHPADVANLFESLPIEDRRVVWEQFSIQLAAEALVEVSTGIREWLIEETPRDRTAIAVYALVVTATLLAVFNAACHRPSVPILAAASRTAT